MANRLKVAKFHSIQLLHSMRWSQRRIACEVWIDRETVRKYLADGLQQARPAISSAGSTPEATSSGAGRPSACEPFREVILAMLCRDLSAQRIYQDLVAEHDFPSSYDSVKRFVRKCQTRRPLPLRRPAGHSPAQVWLFLPRLRLRRA